jgi:hypothetical protein
MIHIETKTILRNNILYWDCFGTVKGYDYYFISPSINEAQYEMTPQLTKLGVNPDDCVWETPVYTNVSIKGFNSMNYFLYNVETP